MIPLPRLRLGASAGLLALASLVHAQQPAPAPMPSPAPASATASPPAASPPPERPRRGPDMTLRTVTLDEERMRDCQVWVDEAAGTYYLVTASGYRGPNGRACVVAFTSKDLATWHGPHVIFEVPEDFWSQRGIWAPELHKHGDKFYLFLTFNTDDPFPEQWRDWYPRVKRGSQVLVADSPLGPFRAFDHTRSTLPPDMMTLDGTLYVEDGQPWMVFCHEWVQI